MRRIVRHLSVEIGPRAPGSPAEQAAAEWLFEQLEALGLPVVREVFDSPSCLAAAATLQVGSRDFAVTPVQFSPAGEAQGVLVFLGNEELAAETPFPPGAIGLLMPCDGLFARQALIRALAAKGLGGLIVISPFARTTNGKIVRDPTQTRLPVATVTHDVAEALLRQAGKPALLEVRHHPATAAVGRSQNVVATLAGRGPHWLAVCAHYDSAAGGPGALDNASGVAGLLAVARALCRKRPAATILFVATGSEEYGGLDLTGRGMLDFYGRRRERLADCIGLVDIDDIGHRIGTPYVYVGGPRPFRDAAAAAPWSLPRLFRAREKFEGGDNGAATQFGVPYVWFYDHSLKSYYHTPDDTLRHADFAKMAAFVPDIAAMTTQLAAQRPFFPFAKTESGVTVRPARYEDIPAIREITTRAFPPVSLGRMKQDFFGAPLGGREWSDIKGDDVEAFCRGHNYQVVAAETDGRVVGYATWLADHAQGLAEIGNNAVHPDWQGRGIGGALQREIDRRIREEGFTRATVSTLGVDLPAQRLYERLGYVRYAESLHYLRRE